MILDCLGRNPNFIAQDSGSHNSNFPDSGFHKKNFPDFGICIPLHSAKTESRAQLL